MMAAVLTDDQLLQWQENGYVASTGDLDGCVVDAEQNVRYLVLPGFYSEQETAEMMGRAKELLDAFDPSGHPMVRIPSRLIPLGPLAEWMTDDIQDWQRSRGR